MLPIPGRFSTRYEVVTALQFHGTPDSATGIIAAFHLAGGRYRGTPRGDGELEFVVNGCHYFAVAGDYIVRQPGGRFLLLSRASFHEHYTRPIDPNAEAVIVRAIAAATRDGYVSAGPAGPSILAVTLSRVLLEALENEGV
jgi:hypothetical protein